MDNKKAQIDMRELILTLVIVGAIAIVGVLIFAAVKNTGDSILDRESVTVRNESVTITIELDPHNNYTSLAKTGYVTNSESIANATSVTDILTRGTDYAIALGGTKSSGADGNIGNLTIDDQYNATALKVTYQFQRDSASQITIDNVSTTVLDSFELGVIALIVLAAVVILAILFKLGSR